MALARSKIFFVGISTQNKRIYLSSLNPKLVHAQIWALANDISVDNKKY
jgi:hypothetical protein